MFIRFFKISQSYIAGGCHFNSEVFAPKKGNTWLAWLHKCSTALVQCKASTC